MQPPSGQKIRRMDDVARLEFVVEAAVQDNHLVETVVQVPV
jgi:hypothetical protein